MGNAVKFVAPGVRPRVVGERRARRATRGASRSRTTASASSRATPSACSACSSACTRATSSRAPASGSRSRGEGGRAPRRADLRGGRARTSGTCFEFTLPGGGRRVSPLASHRPARVPARRGQRGRRPAHARGAARGRRSTCGCRRSATATRRSRSCAARRASRTRPGPDLVLLDLNLPRKSGLEVLDEMRADESLAQIPVIMLTSSAAQSDVEAALRPRGERVRDQAARARRLHGPDRGDPRLLAGRWPGYHRFERWS